ncbi:MAG: hypothetical protein V1747_10935 [Candidatus Omnitrophota bacterium]
MKKIIFIIILFFTPIFTLNANPNTYTNIFSIPSYPGTESFKSHSAYNSMLNLPFATSLKVFRTKDGAPLQKEDVIKFYREYYESRGWQKGIVERKDDEPYLGLRVQVYGSNSMQATVHVAGNLYLWVAPQDGMLTIYMSQWRISSLKQDSATLYKKIEEKLEKISHDINYSINKATSYSNWEDYYQNEYLINCKVFTLSNKSNPSQGCLDTKNIIHVTLLAYKDTTSANEQAKEFKTNGLYQFRERTIVQNSNILILLDSQDKTQTGIVEQIAENIDFK